MHVVMTEEKPLSENRRGDAQGVDFAEILTQDMAEPLSVSPETDAPSVAAARLRRGSRTGVGTACDKPLPAGLRRPRRGQKRLYRSH